MRAAPLHATFTIPASTTPAATFLCVCHRATKQFTLATLQTRMGGGDARQLRLAQTRGEQATNLHATPALA